MRKLNLLILISAIIVLSGVLLLSCKKGQTNESSNGKTFVPNLKPVSLPTFNSMNEVNDQLRALAYSLASITDNTYMANDYPREYKELLEDYIENGEDEVTFGKINNNIDMFNVGIFTYPSGTTPPNFKTFVDVTIQNQTPWYLSTSPRNWGPNSYNFDAYEGFIFNNTQYNTLLRIPEFFELKQNPGRFDRPFLVVPNEVDVNGDILLPIVGYSFNFGSDKVDVITFNTEEELDDNTDYYYIWVVDALPIPVQTTNTSGGCIGDNAPRQNDGHCDYECGETLSNSFNDCNPQFIKDAWISDIEISEDYKAKCGSGYQWNESFIQGKYELAYSSVVAYGSGKTMPFGGLFNKFWHRSEVKKSKKVLFSCNYSSKGSATMKEVKNREWWTRSIENRTSQNDENLQPKSYIARNYHPKRDTIYFFIYEEDNAPQNMRTQKVYYRPNRSVDMQFFSRNGEGPWGDKKMFGSTIFYGSIIPFGPSNSSPNGHVIMITPDSWPGGGNSFNDEILIKEVLSSNGTNTNTRSIKLRIKYDQS